MDPSGTSRLLLICTEEVLYGAAFIENTCSEDCVYVNKSVRDPSFLPLLVQMPLNSMEKELVWPASRLMRATWS